MTAHLERLEVLLAVLGVCRITQVLVADDLLRRWREWVSVRSRRRAETKHRLNVAERGPDYFAAHRYPWRIPYAYKAKLVSCPWCMSIWVGTVVVIGMRIAHTVTLYVLAVFSLSLIAVAIDHALDRFLPDDPGPAATPQAEPAPRAEPGPEVVGFLDQLET